MKDNICTIAIAGCGHRGLKTYGFYQERFPDKMKVVAVADTDAERVKYAGDTFDIPQENRFDSAEAMLEREKLADALFLCTKDQQHVSQAIAAMKKGYDILLEKPISPSLEECREIVRVYKETGRKILVCHVLRYTVLNNTLKELLDNGTIGDIVSVQHIEKVAYWHQAHSFVRGNWRRSDETSPMILQKCCHDTDLLLWLVGKHCRSVSSYGSNYLFKKEKAPIGSTERCTDDCKVKDTCPYNAEYYYLKSKAGAENGYRDWPTSMLALDPTPENVREALRTGPYGRCVYRCDNDVVDHQVVNMELDDGVTCQFTMTAFTADGGRETRVMGTHGEILAKEREIRVMPFGKDAYTIDINKLTDDFSGHGGGDPRMVEEFLDIVSGRSEGSVRTTSLEDSVESHFVCLAAERSRLENGRSVPISEVAFDL